MGANMRCPRCRTDLLSSFPFGFISKPAGPASTYICTGCKFLFAMGADLDKQELGSPTGDSYNDSQAINQSSVPIQPFRFWLCDEDSLDGLASP